MHSCIWWYLLYSAFGNCSALVLFAFDLILEIALRAKYNIENIDNGIPASKSVIVIYGFVPNC